MLSRPDALRLLADRHPEDAIVLTLGGTVREMIAVAGRRRNHLPLLDAMGQPAAIGLGLALGLARAGVDRRVLVVEGDGSILMGLSALATIGHLRPSNLALIVFDNGVYLATGGQPTAAGSVDLAAVALGCGWRAARAVEPTASAYDEALDWMAGQEGPVLLRVPVSTDDVATDYFLEDPVILAREFMEWLDSVRPAS